MQALFTEPNWQLCRLDGCLAWFTFLLSRKRSCKLHRDKDRGALMQAPLTEPNWQLCRLDGCTADVVTSVSPVTGRPLVPSSVYSAQYY